MHDFFIYFLLALLRDDNLHIKTTMAESKAIMRVIDTKTAVYTFCWLEPEATDDVLTLGFSGWQGSKPIPFSPRLYSQFPQSTLLFALARAAAGLVVAQEEFQRHAAEVPDVVRFGIDAHAFGGECGARGNHLVVGLVAHHADHARGFVVSVRGIAQRRDVVASLTQFFDERAVAAHV